MIGIYFSGTGNTKFCIDIFMKEYDNSSNVFSIEDKEALEEIKKNQEIAIAYPVQYSNIPKILQDYIIQNSEVWKEKRIFIIATMGLFSGDGAGVLARLLKKYNAIVIGGMHLKMPDSISDERALKRTYKKNKELVERAKIKIHTSVFDIKNGTPPQEGLGLPAHLAGLFGQRLYFFWKTKEYSNKLKIRHENCIGCGLCEKICPMNNIMLKNGIPVAKDKCTMCYRCINRCPKQAITLLGNKVIQQNDINDYL